MKWGKDNEAKACQAYVDYMRKDGHPTLEVKKCGFFIHPKKG